jgi:hypothetical protein
MSIGPQTSAVGLDTTAALPGMVACNAGKKVHHYIATEALPFGVVVELDPNTAGNVRLPKTASAVGKLAGVTMFDSVRQSGGYAAGDQVPVMRQGEIYVSFTGTTDAPLTAAKVRSASDDSNSEAQHRGKLTDASTSTTTGQEVYLTKILFKKDVSDTSLCIAVLEGPLQ